MNVMWTEMRSLGLWLVAFSFHWDFISFGEGVNDAAAVGCFLFAFIEVFLYHSVSTRA